MEYSQQISNIFHSVLDSFDKDVISTKFGLKNLTRADLLNENSNIATKIHGTDKLILICDGTYIRHQKSTNNTDSQNENFFSSMNKFLIF